MRRTINFVALLGAVFLLTPACSSLEVRQVGEDGAEMDGDGITRVEVELGAGDLQIMGLPEQETLAVDLEIWGLTRANCNVDCGGIDDGALDALRVELREIEPGTARLFVGFEPEMPRYWVDVALWLPAGMELVVDDGSGDCIISGVGQLWLDDQGGDTAIDGILGDVYVWDGEGALEILDVVGNVNVEDGGGDLLVETVDGDVTLLDGAGDIEVRDVTGRVTIQDEGGDILVSGAGEVDICDTGGDVRVY